MLNCVFPLLLCKLMSDLETQVSQLKSELPSLTLELSPDHSDGMVSPVSLMEDMDHTSSWPHPTPNIQQEMKQSPSLPAQPLLLSTLIWPSFVVMECVTMEKLPPTVSSIVSLYSWNLKTLMDLDQSMDQLSTTSSPTPVI